MSRCKYSYTTLLHILKISNRTKTSQNKIKKMKLVLLYTLFLHSDDPTHVASRNVISNCLHCITLFIIFEPFINIKIHIAGILYLLHYFSF